MANVSFTRWRMIAACLKISAPREKADSNLDQVSLLAISETKKTDPFTFLKSEKLFLPKPKELRERNPATGQGPRIPVMTVCSR
jgi:hypothetical protein